MRSEKQNPMKYIYFLKEIIVRDIKRKYYKSVLGLVWTVLGPLMMMVVVTIVFSTLFKKSIPHFPVYWLCGNLLFAFNSGSTNQSIDSMVSNAGLLKKIYVPKYIFVLSPICVNFVNLLFSIISLIIVVLVTGSPITIYFLLIPIPILYIFLFTTGLSLILSANGVFFRDLKHLYSIVILAWTYLTPLFYPISIIPQKFLFIMELNPLYHFITIFRDLAYIGVMPSTKSLIIATAYSIITLILGIVVFKEKEDKFYLYV